MWKIIKQLPGRLVHPISLIAVVQITWTTALILWIFYFIKRYQQIAALAPGAGLRVQDLVSWAPLVVGIVLLGLIFVGTLALTLILAKQSLINRQMKIFLSFVSHELRTPLTSIRLALETFRDHELAPEQKNFFIENMLEDTDRLTQQIAQILDASRVERGRLSMHRELLELDQYLSRYVERYSQKAELRGRRLLLTAKTPVTILGDREQLQTVLDNLINNAERYSTPNSPIHLELSQNNHWAVITVRDEGKGLETKERKKIFRLFYRGSAARNASGRGSGLGLFVVKGIVEQHRGKVSAFSEGPNRGATFKVWLPIVRQRIARKS